jgi:hypothetical protein
MITITEAIHELRQQLADAQASAVGQKLQFNTKTVEIELAVVLKRETQGEAKVKAWVVDVSGQLKGAEETTHKVKLVIEPVQGGSPVVVRDTTVEVP